MIFVFNSANKWHLKFHIPIEHIIQIFNVPENIICINEANVVLLQNKPSTQNNFAIHKNSCLSRCNAMFGLR